MFNTITHLQLAVCNASGITLADYDEPVVFVRNGDIELGLFTPAMGTHQVVMVDDLLNVLRDDTYNTMAEALEGLHRIIRNEYGVV